MQSRRWHTRVVLSASRPVRELAIRELSSNLLNHAPNSSEMNALITRSR